MCCRKLDQKWMLGYTRAAPARPDVEHPDLSVHGGALKPLIITFWLKQRRLKYRRSLVDQSPFAVLLGTRDAQQAGNAYRALPRSHRQS